MIVATIVGGTMSVMAFALAVTWRVKAPTGKGR
jgi:hypothetical protein